MTQAESLDAPAPDGGHASLSNGATHHTNGNGVAQHANGNGAGYSNGHANGNGANGSTTAHEHDDAVEQDDEEHEMFPEDMSLRIMGIGVQYPPHRILPRDLQSIAEKYYPQTDSMKKVLSINRYTGIDARCSIGETNHPLANQPTAPTITQLHETFIEHGVPLATSACRTALQDAGYPASAITHSVFTTCTDSANPGYDTLVLQNLHARTSVEKVLLHGVGCAGGLTALRTACNIALGAKARGRRARVLVCATELCTVLCRSELDSIAAEDSVRIGITLFSDCSSAVVVSNGVGEEWGARGVYDVLGWKHDLVRDTEKELGFDVDPSGWKVILTPKVPQITSTATPPLYKSLLSSIPTSVLSTLTPAPTAIAPRDLDWALHPGGSLILTALERKMGLSPSQLRASYEIYTSFGNSSSATAFSVMDRLRSDSEVGVAGEGPLYGPGIGVRGGRKGVLACAFGPGVSLEMLLLRRVGDPSMNGTNADGVEELAGGVQRVRVGGEELD
ncbi:hypothetical protein Dda_1603 [Drechslerella dactyloides]|uniref:Uncharacterized protein n=1 Tax=Drechslerella dactyloides TaxID=74499 RepID=A0AAD6J3S1_DREDA|nr:hypothetical protein Dda_1603 [Drechslerella dactyloides]